MAHIKKLGTKRYKARGRTPSGREYGRTFSRRVDAERFIHEQEAGKQRGVWLDSSAGKVLFQDWSDQWLVGKIKLRAPTRNKYRSLLDNHLIEAFGRMRVNMITRLAVQQWVYDLTAKGYAAKTVQECSGLLASIMAEAVEEGLIAKTPCRKLELPAKEHVERRFLTEDEVEVLTLSPRPRSIRR